MKYVLDTNIVLYFLGGQLAEPLPLGDCFISIISQIELLSYPQLSSKDEKQIYAFLNEIEIVDLTNPVRDICIDLRKKKLLKLPDAIIAATALSIDAKLLTNDQAFDRIPNLLKKSLRI